MHTCAAVTLERNYEHVLYYYELLSLSNVK